jgi:hypothetical protein
MSMIRHATGPRPRSRSGISLTEILIGIMILGIGLVSLATLFPIGLLRLREAQRQSRTAYLLQSAGADMAARGLLNPISFINPYISPWYITNPSGSYDPWIQDTPAINTDWSGGGDWTLAGAFSGLGGLGKRPYTELDLATNPWTFGPVLGPGLPVAYDPLWRAQTIHPTTGVPGIAPNDPVVEARFGAGVGPLRVLGADGLQRLTNLQTIPPINATVQQLAFTGANRNSIYQAFVSPEDVVWQETTGTGYLDLGDLTGATTVTTPSPVVPDVTQTVQANLLAGNSGLPPVNNLSVNDWRFTWMFTGQRQDTFNGTVYDGNIVIFENRPFAIDPIGDDYQVAGEQVVLAAFGYSGLNVNSVSIGTMADGTAVYYGTSNNTVLLYWPSSMPDPEIKPGGWIADVTYVRRQSLELQYFQFGGVVGGGGPPGQRCYWYQVSRVTAPASIVGTTYSAVAGGADYRYMLVSTSTPLKVKTLLMFNNGQTVPYHADRWHNNAALVSPYVANVIPRTFTLP